MRCARGLLTLPLLASMLVACASPRRAPGAVADLKPAERPSSNSDEAGLWMQMDRTEARLKASDVLVRDPGLGEYVHGIVCRLVSPYCESIRVYVVRKPEFHASMAPNGMMQVGTGLLLRIANEAQLAFILGHEIGHYLRRHSLQRWEEIKAKSPNPAAERGSIAAFSREMEHEADRIGSELMVKGGYDPREAPRAWERLMAEPAPPRNSRPNVFLATHPTTTERVARLREYAEKAVVTGTEPRTGREDYLAKLRPVRRSLLNDEVRRRQFGSSEVLLRYLIEDGEGLGELHFYVGEIHRLRGDQDDLPKALAAYRRALDFPDVPPDTLRSLGIVYVRTGDRAAARDAFARYLELQPNAEDREMIKSQIADLETSR